MDWRVLGPLEVVADGSLINLGGRQRRLVLAILLANADQTVSTDRVVEEVWGGAPPSSARKTVQAHVAHLRGAVNGDAEFLSSSGDGYVLRPGSMTVDADRFEAAVAEARELRSGEPAHVASLLETTLAMFRGEPYTGLADDALTVKIEAARLDELRLTCRGNDAAFHPTRPELATAGGDGTMKFWDVETGTLRLSIPAPVSVSDLDYSPDGRYLAALGEQGFVTVYMLDVAELVDEAETRLTRWWTETECRQYLDSDTCPDSPEHLAD